MKILLVLQGYTSKRFSLGKVDSGTTQDNDMNDFFKGYKYIKKIF